jgi:integrase
LLLTGFREQELYFLAWPDVDLKKGTVRVTAKPEEGFSPKDYEERPTSIPPDLVDVLKALPQTSRWVFPTRKATA